MTYEQTREQFLLAWNSNAYLNMCESDDMHNAIVALEKQIPRKPMRTLNGAMRKGRQTYFLNTALSRLLARWEIGFIDRLIV